MNICICNAVFSFLYLTICCTISVCIHDDDANTRKLVSFYLFYQHEYESYQKGQQIYKYINSESSCMQRVRLCLNNR